MLFDGPLERLFHVHHPVDASDRSSVRSADRHAVFVVK
jgi:hypothetical protein